MKMTKRKVRIRPVVVGGGRFGAPKYKHEVVNLDTLRVIYTAAHFVSCVEKADEMGWDVINLKPGK